jgi:hypothetical protein
MIANKKILENTFHKCTPTFIYLFFTNVLTHWVPSKYPKLGGGDKKKKSFNCGKALLRKDIITIREAHARWSREKSYKSTLYKAPKKTL